MGVGHIRTRTQDYIRHGTLSEQILRKTTVAREKLAAARAG